METLFEGGRVVDLILVVMIIEAVILCGLAIAWRDRLPLAGLLLNLAAGASLLLALRAVLTDADLAIAGLWLGVALFAHLGDLAQRLKRR